MKKAAPKAVIVSVSSDIGHALAKRWVKQGIRIIGTYRKASPLVTELRSLGVKTLPCDLSRGLSVRKACAKLRSSFGQWDYLVLCPGTLTPVGPFANVDFSEWQKSVEVNFIRQLQFVHGLLPSRNLKSGRPPVVLFFAGGGTNNATVHYSAYTISKIALIKMCELLDAEIPDTNFVILGPGWVKTKIHEATLQARGKAGANYRKTIQKLASQECMPMERVLDCCDWAVQAPRRAVGGRNFSVAFDPWTSPVLVKKLAQEPDMYKLRRHLNYWKALS